MLEELTPDIIWISGLGAVVVFGLMMVVWFVSTRESGVKNDPGNSLPSIAFSKIGKRKKQYGSPRKKKEVIIASESNDSNVTKAIKPDNPLLMAKDDTKPHDVREPSDVQGEEEKAKAIKVHTREPKGLSTTDQRPLSVPKKVKTKVKPPHTVGVEMTGSQIVEAVTNSTLSEEEVQQVMEKLLEKQDEEWEATGKADNIKTLKKTNEELVARCHDAEKAAQLHSYRVKELGSELKQERSRLLASEKSFQLKSGKQQEDIENLRKKVLQYKEEVVLLKEKVDTGKVDAGEISRLEETYSQQLSQLTSEKTQLNTQVKEFRDAKKQLSHKLIKESEKVVAIQAEKQTLDGELQNNQEEKKRLELEIAAIKDTVQSLHLQLVNAEDALAKEKTLNLTYSKDDEETLQLMNTLKQEHDATLQNLRDSHSSELKEVKVQLEETKTALSQLEVDKKEKVSELTNLDEVNTSLKTSVQDLEEQVQKLSEERKTDEPVIQDQSIPAPQDRTDSDEELTELKKQVADMQQKIDDLKSKNNTLRDKSWKARDELETAIKECNEKLKENEREYQRQMRQLKEETINEEHLHQKEFLVTIFPNLNEVVDEEFDEWLKNARQYISDKLRETKEECEKTEDRINEMTREIEDGSQLTNELRDTLSDTLAKLEDLMKKWEEKEICYQDTISEGKALADEEIKTAKEKLEKLSAEHDHVTSQLDSLEKEKEKLVKELTKSLSDSQSHANSLQLTIDKEVSFKAESSQATREKEEVEKKLNEVEKEVSSLKSTNENLTQQLAEHVTETEHYKSKLDESESLAESLRAANQDLNQRFSKFSPPPNNSTSSEV